MDNKILIYAGLVNILVLLIGTGCQTSGGPAREQVLDLYHSHDKHTIYFNSDQRVSEVLVKMPDRRLLISDYTQNKNWLQLFSFPDPPSEDVQDQRYIIYHVISKTEINNRLLGLGPRWLITSWDNAEENIICRGPGEQMRKIPFEEVLKIIQLQDSGSGNFSE